MTFFELVAAFTISILLADAIPSLIVRSLDLVLWLLERFRL